MILPISSRNTVFSFNNKKKEQEQFENEAKDYKQSLNNVEKKIFIEENHRNKFNFSIQNIEKRISSIKKEILIFQQDIERTKGELSELDTNINDDFKKLKERIRAIDGSDFFCFFNFFYTENNFDFYDKLKTIASITKHDTNLINGLKEKKFLLEEKKKTLKFDEDKFDSLLKNFSKELKDLQSHKEQSEFNKQKYLEEQKQILLDLKNNKEKINSVKQEIKNESLCKQQNIEETQKNDEKTEKSSDNNHNVINVQEQEKNKNTGQKKEIQNSLFKGFVWPVPSSNTISCHFGYGILGIVRRFHTGIDISASKGSSVLASTSGTVVDVYKNCPHNYSKECSCGCNGGYGNYVKIVAPDNHVTVYAHLSEVHVNPSENVKSAQIIGTIGSTGFSTGPHLHFEVRKDNQCINPANFFIFG
jgi:murein DD-endopeptidase MepM/ murein hydrolase activator NlpD